LFSITKDEQRQEKHATNQFFRSLLESHGVAVQMLKTKQVGYVVYEYEYQIVAEPFADTKC